MNRLTQFRRDRAASRIVSNGKQLDRVRAARSCIDGSHEHAAVDAAFLDGEINALQAKVDSDLAFIRKTAPEA